MTTATDPATLEEMVREDPYRRWLEMEGVRVITDFAFEDLNTVELGPWPRKGGRGAVINIPYDDLPKDAHIIELDPRATSEPEHHLYELMIYTLSGRGSTTVWYDKARSQSFEWSAGAVFSIPLNAWYEISNGSGVEPARYIAVTEAPVAMRHYRNLDFVLNNPCVFEERMRADQFDGVGKMYKNRAWDTSFIPDVLKAALYDRKIRGGGARNVYMEMAQNNMHGFISQFEAGTYKNGHRHGPGAHLFILSGTGYTLFWQEGGEYRKSDWKPGAMLIVPTDNCFHQHFATGGEPVRYMAFLGGGRRFGSLSESHENTPAARSIEEGGWQVEYKNEDPYIHQLFERELANNGAPCRMKGMAPGCTGESM